MSKNTVWITHNGHTFHKSKGCIHLRYARRRGTLCFVPQPLAEKSGDTPCKTCYGASASCEAVIVLKNKNGKKSFIKCDFKATKFSPEELGDGRMVKVGFCEHHHGEWISSPNHTSFTIPPAK